MIEELEQLREALASAHQLAAAQAQRLREQDLALSGIAALHTHDDPTTLIDAAFRVLAEALPFDRAMFLEPRADGFVCIAATDPSVIDIVWPSGGFFQRVAKGRATAVPDEARVPEWADRSDPAPLKGAIYAPIAAAAGPGLLVLESTRHGVYSAADLAIVSRLGIFVSQTLAAAQRRQLAEVARAAEAERGLAVAANEAKSQFLANMSHEIRTPLNGVTTVAALLAQSGLTGRQQEMAQLIVSSGQALEGLLNDVLDLAKIESGQLTVEDAPFDLAAALASTFELFAIRAGEQALEFNVGVAPEARSWFMGDAARLRQIAANLLSNAVKFTRQGRVDVSLAVEDDEVVLRVRDTGLGFDDEVATRLFQRFEQADGSVTRSFGGTGLGLSVSQSLAQMMGGKITCTSAPGIGSEFVLRLPAVTAQAPEGRAPPAAKFPDTAEARALSILVAEDNPNNRRIVGMVLELIAAPATFVENGAEAVAAFERQTFDIVLMDLQMPVMDGLAATRRIREIEADRSVPPLPIIALSANAMVHHVQAALDAGASAHVAKPIDPAGLIATIQDLLAESGEAAALRSAEPSRRLQAATGERSA